MRLELESTGGMAVVAPSGTQQSSDVSNEIQGSLICVLFLDACLSEHEISQDGSDVVWSILFPSCYCQRGVGNCWERTANFTSPHVVKHTKFNPLNAELNPICPLLALFGAHHILHVSRIRVKLLTFRLLMSYIYGAPILDVSRSHTTTQHSR